jgi:TnpA family transposase
VLDGLLENDSVLRLREHSTDTHGYIEDLFGLCYLLGYSFMPRIRDLADQQLYRIDRNAVYPDLAGLFRGGVDADLIWIAVEDLARVSPLLHRHVIPNGTYHFPRAIEGVNLS